MFNCSFKSSILLKHLSAQKECLPPCHCPVPFEPATLNDRSLAALEAGIESIALATIDKRVSKG